MKLIQHLSSFAGRTLAAFVVVCVTVASPATAATFQGEFWSVNSPQANINDAVQVINGSAPTATFLSTAIDYPNGNVDTTLSFVSLNAFLGADAGSIVGDGTAPITTSVFRFTGFLDLMPGQQTFALGSDDGYRLTIGGNVVSQQNSPRSFRFTTLNNDLGAGVEPFELIFYENFGRTGVEFFIDNALAVPSAVPLPGAFMLALSSVSVLALMGWRRRTRTVKIPLANPA